MIYSYPFSRDTCCTFDNYDFLGNLWKCTWNNLSSWRLGHQGNLDCIDNFLFLKFSMFVRNITNLYHWNFFSPCKRFWHSIWFYCSHLSGRKYGMSSPNPAFNIQFPQKHYNMLYLWPVIYNMPLIVSWVLNKEKWVQVVA